jgi:hypothetical protein
MMEEVIEGYMDHLGYDGDKHVYEFEDPEEEDGIWVPECIHILAKWPNGSFTAHFNVGNDVRSVFWSLDETADPSLCEMIWCTCAEEGEHIDSDSPGGINWKELARKK